MLYFCRRSAKKDNWIATKKYGARSNVPARVKSIKNEDVMCLVKFDILIPAEMVSVLTTVSLELLALKASDETQL